MYIFTSSNIDEKSPILQYTMDNNVQCVIRKSIINGGLFGGLSEVSIKKNGYS